MKPKMMAKICVDIGMTLALLMLMPLHLGLHWSLMMGMAKKAVKKPSAVRTWILRVLALAIAGYGVSAFVKREVGSYMLLKIQFVFFDFE